jgi:hypothetical protein
MISKIKVDLGLNGGGFCAISTYANSCLNFANLNVFLHV